jgi:hypothetical protein
MSAAPALRRHGLVAGNAVSGIGTTGVLPSRLRNKVARAPTRTRPE